MLEQEKGTCQICGKEIQEVLDGPSNMHRLLIYHYEPWGRSKEFKTFFICDKCVEKIKNIFKWQ